MLPTFTVACLGIRCRKGTAGLLVDLADLWSEGEPSMEVLSKYHVCGKSSPTNFWVSVAPIFTTSSFICGRNTVSWNPSVIVFWMSRFSQFYIVDVRF